MSVLMNFAMFPTDKGSSVSPYVSKITALIRSKGYKSQLSSMGTIVETDTLPQALAVIEESYALLESDCDRVYLTVNIDIQKNKSNRIESKIQSVEDKLTKKEF
ncbi:MAG: MTH1187 family thiamine-binding protein [Bacteroidales bacterium]|nr:MTH1187 family thiamine-binding protein [Bacteroidales bacterium]MBN2750061.1 MTH1187 family thiamine-binding protein [Bacteroidales bacterium]